MLVFVAKQERYNSDTRWFTTSLICHQNMVFKNGDRLYMKRMNIAT